MHVRRDTRRRPGHPRALAGEATAQIYDQVQASGARPPALSFVVLSPDGHLLWACGPPGAAPSDQYPRSHPRPCTPAAGARAPGAALMHAVPGAAGALGEPRAAIAGSPATAPGSSSGPAELRIDPPKADWQPCFMVRPLTRHTPAMPGPGRRGP